jgi:hypothetical protein
MVKSGQILHMLLQRGDGFGIQPIDYIGSRIGFGQHCEQDVLQA